MIDFDSMYTSMDTPATGNQATDHGADGLDALYPEMDASPAESDELYPEMDDGPEAAEDTQAEFTEAAGADSISRAISDSFRGQGVDQAVLSEVSGRLAAVGVSAQQAPELAKLYQQETARRSREFWGSDPASWRSQSERQFDSGHIQAAAEAVRQYGDPQLKRLMNSSMGDHPAMVNVLGKMSLEIRQLRARLGRVYRQNP
jgi:hypothetical protein